MVEIIKKKNDRDESDFIPVEGAPSFLLSLDLLSLEATKIGIIHFL